MYGFIEYMLSFLTETALSIINFILGLALCKTKILDPIDDFHSILYKKKV
jgi:hypothetical protein